MTVLFFSRLFYPHIGGVERHVLEVSRLLIKKGHKVSLVCESHDSSLAFTEKKDGIKIYRIFVGESIWFKKFQIWKWMWRNKELIKNADIVHCHDVFFWYLPFRFLYPTKPVFTTFHGYEDYPLKSRWLYARKISEKLSFGNICIGDFMKKWYGTKPTFISYGGVNKIKSDPTSLKLRGAGKREKKSENSAIFIGRLDEQTGIKTYASAVKLIRKKYSNFKIEIIGDGKFRKEIEKNFKVLGFQKNPEKYYPNYRFAFVSRYLSILEAMAAKRLVFAVYDNPLKKDYLRMAPFSKLINIANSDEDLAKQVLYFLNNKEKEEIMVSKAFEWVRTKTWESVVRQYISLWNLV